MGVFVLQSDEEGTNFECNFVHENGQGTLSD